jgi:hypothetical protein
MELEEDKRQLNYSSSYCKQAILGKINKTPAPNTNGTGVFVFLTLSSETKDIMKSLMLSLYYNLAATMNINTRSSRLSV